MDPRYKSPTTAVADHGADDEFRDLTTLTAVVVWLLRIGAALAVLSLWSSWLQLDLLSRPFTRAEGAVNDHRELMVGGAVSVLMIVTIVIFGRWIVLAHRNLPALGAQHLEFRPGWAVGYFFIPVLNWWKPYQAMRSLWQSSRSVQRPELQDSPWILPAWWTLWVVWSLQGNVTWRMQSGAQTVEGLALLTRIELFGHSLYLLLCIAASLVVARIWQAQAAQRENPERYEPAKGFADAA
jgi:hypothetical protein